MAAGSGAVDDLASLSKLTEQTLITELQLRYRDGHIYTYIGDILIAVNPFEPLQLYSTQISKQYRDLKIQSKLPPHVFAIADRMYQNLLLNNEPQSCIVSGESGAGKTETTKLLIRQLVQQCPRSTDSLVANLHDALIEINPLMEAFGNAKTTMNENSSRFGKYIELFFTDDGQISGGRVSIFLLEKTRVTGFGKDEQNFHIFYHLFAGLTDRQREQILLGKPAEYRVLQSGVGPVFKVKSDQVHHKAKFFQLQKIFTDIDFSQEDIDTIYAYLSAILHLTNIRFEMDQETDGVFIADEYPLLVATELLGLPVEELATALISNINSIRGERIVSLKNLAQAADGRDALARSLYSRLFSWIINKINVRLKPSRGYAPKKLSSPVIGLLDIAGFENFSVNGFEQLCINVSNEQLQHFFNQHVFAWERKDLENEGVKTSHISFTNNSSILSMFIEKPIGLYALLDEESRFPRATAHSLLEKLRKHLIKHPHIKKEKGKEPHFSIHHYAGWVKYSVAGMLEKNRDTLSQNILECLQKSESGMIYELFSSQQSANGELASQNGRQRTKRSVLMCKQPLSLERGKSLSKSAGRMLKQHMKQALKETQDESYFKHRTAASQFQDSLAALNNKLMLSKPHFIRCIKPNGLQTRKVFDEKLVSQQLKYTGIMETVRIRHEGFPVRLSFQVFLDRYRFITYSLTSQLAPEATSCYPILKAAGLHQWEFGTRKVFLKYWHPEQLTVAMEQQVKRVVVVQRVIRGFIGRRKANRLRQILVARKQAQAKSFLMSIAEKGQLMFNDLRELNNQDLRQYKRQLAEEARAAEELRVKERMAEEKKRKLQLLAAEKEKKEAELRLQEAKQKVDDLAAAKSPAVKSPIGGNFKLKAAVATDTAKNTWRKQHANHKEHVSGLRHLLESKAADERPSPIMHRRRPGLKGAFSNVDNSQPPGPCPYGVGRKLMSKPTHQANGFTPTNPPSQVTYEQGNVSHYARQNSQGKLRVSKADHYEGLIQEALTSDVHSGAHWAKLVYMEKRQRCATFVLKELEVRVDGSHYSSNPQAHVALNSVDNPLRDEQVTRIREHIGKGLTLEIDAEGNILATRLGVNDIIVHDYRNPSISCISEDVIKHKGALQRDVRIKLFDMQEFRSHIILELHKRGARNLNVKDLYSRCCIVSLSLVKATMDEMEDPCWLNIIHLGAMRMLQSKEVLASSEKELRRIMSSNIDLAKISQLPSFIKVEPKAAGKRGKKDKKVKETTFMGIEKIYDKPALVLDRGAKPAQDITFQRQTNREWVKQRHRPG